MKFHLVALFLLISSIVCSAQDTLQESRHLEHIHQLTYGGDNAEAYFSFSGKELTCQVTNQKWGAKCDQIYLFDIAKAEMDTAYRPPLTSTGMGRTTCSYFLPGDKKILYASTHKSGKECPETGDLQKGGKYLWPIFPSFDIYVADRKGKIVEQLTNTNGYDAEATVSPDGKKIVFTSIRSGDLEVWTIDIDGKNLKQITHELGYDGGAFFSPDSKEIVFRASRPKTEQEVNDYKELLVQNLVAPTEMELFTCHADGSAMHQVTHLGKANWAPFFHPSGKKVLFSSNYKSKKGWDFQLYMINLDGTGLEQITKESSFNAFPMFSPDGKRLVWSSNRNNHGTHDTNVFIANWKD